MKRLFLFLIIAVSLLGSNHAHAQIGFDEDLLPGPQMDYTQTIDTGDYIIWNFLWMNNVFYGRKNADGSYEGFTYSNIKDSITPGLVNDRAAFPAIGAQNSAQYGIGRGICGMHVDMLPGVKPALDAVVYSLYVTNATCAVLSMEHGDSTAKKFGGVNGTDPDWFLLTIKGYNHTDRPVDSVLFYLADFRSDTSSNDYIIKDWTEVDLSAMGWIDSLSFSLSSSDTGMNGMNTPPYFCIDNILVEHGGSIQEYNKNKSLVVYPDPVAPGGMLYLNDKVALANEKYTIRMSDANGRTVLKKEIRSGNPLALPYFSPGLYFLTIKNAEQKIIGQQKISVR